jgi:hypothetical protein
MPFFNGHIDIVFRIVLIVREFSAWKNEWFAQRIKGSGKI